MVGDLASLGARVDALDALVAERRTAAAEERAAAKAAALAAREAIVAEAEPLAESTQWKATGERFKALLDEWKAAPRADRTGEQALWKRFSHARSQFDKHRRQYFARLDGERGEAKQVKEALVAEAEALSGSTDWGATAGAYRDLMTRWKAAGRAGKADEDALWTRFRAAQDAFFAARNAALGERDAGFAENLAAKEALLAEAEAIDTSEPQGAPRPRCAAIQERWETIGHVPRGDKERIEGRLRRVEDAVRKGEEEPVAPHQPGGQGPRRGDGRPVPAARSTSSRRRTPSRAPPATPARSPTPSAHRDHEGPARRGRAAAADSALRRGPTPRLAARARAAALRRPTGVRSAAERTGPATERAGSSPPDREAPPNARRHTPLERRRPSARSGGGRDASERSERAWSGESDAVDVVDAVDAAHGLEDGSEVAGVGHLEGEAARARCGRGWC